MLSLARRPLTCKAWAKPDLSGHECVIHSFSISTDSLVTFWVLGAEFATRESSHIRAKSLLPRSSQACRRSPKSAVGMA